MFLNLTRKDLFCRFSSYWILSRKAWRLAGLKRVQKGSEGFRRVKKGSIRCQMMAALKSGFGNFGASGSNLTCDLNENLVFIYLDIA